MTCECDLCKWLAEYRRHIETIDEPVKSFFKEMMEIHLNMGLDRDYYAAIVKNQWPESDKILAKYREAK